MRPAPITILSILAAAAAFYLTAISATMLLNWDVFSFTTGASLLAGFETAGPFAFLIGAVIYACAAYGLWTLRSWARYIAIACAALQALRALPKVSENAISFSIPRMIFTGLPMIVGTALIFYLAKASTIELFKKRTEPK